MIYVRAAKPQKSKKSYLHKGTLRREESFSPREKEREKASCILFYSPAYAPLSAASASPVRTLVCHLRGKPVYAFCEPRLGEECWFLRYIPLGNLTYIIIRGWADCAWKLSLVQVTRNCLQPFLTPLTWDYVRVFERDRASGNHSMSILNRALLNLIISCVSYRFHLKYLIWIHKGELCIY